MKNTDIEETLRNSVKNKKILHSYMFVGSKFTNKKNIAMKFSKHILCNEENDNACNACKSCLEIDSGNHPDFTILELQKDENSIKIEQIRKLQDDIIKKPIVSDRKVYIINNAEKMTTSAQSCLLKTLEEPPKYATIILLVEDESLILNTIKSRCTKVFFSEETISEITEDEKEIYDKLEEVFGNIDNYKLLDLLNNFDLLYKNDKIILDILDYINTILFRNIEKDHRNIEYIEYVEETKKRIKANANFNMCIDNLLFNIWKER